jgi:hypothetical protein
MCGPAIEPSAGAQHFEFIDRRLFARLYNGDLRPLIISLKDGRQMIGEVKGIIRRRQQDGGALRMTGALLFVTANGDVELDYATIADID